MKLKNKTPGGKVIVRSITVSIDPINKWKCIKKVSGVLVENKGYEFYYHMCDGAYGNVRKYLINSSWRGKYAVKLDNNLVDIEGNNIIRVDEEDLIFLDRSDNIKIISKKEYNKALKVIKEYDNQQTLK